jgi:NAD(P)-dependent dehydrogenase (short-subunit alcohol dehydrogenase family)
LESSGIGRAVAVCFAKEGVDITIVYLPDEEPDAKETEKMVEKEGKEYMLIPGDPMKHETCKDAVTLHISRFYLLLEP